MGTRKDGIRRQRDKLRRSRRGVGIGIRPPRIDQHGSAVGPPELLECCSERCEASVPLRIALGESHQHADAPHPIRPLRTRRERPRGCRAAEQPDELAPFHQQFLPCFEAEDSTPGNLPHCGISKQPLSAMGLGCAKTPALALHVEISGSNCISESQIILHTPGSMPCWRIVFSTFRGCMSFYRKSVGSLATSQKCHL